MTKPHSDSPKTQNKTSSQPEVDNSLHWENPPETPRQPMNTHFVLTPETNTVRLLNNIVNCTIGHRGYQDSRPWHITFSCGNYGYYDTALCEMLGSPVKAFIIVRLDSYNANISVLDSSLKSCRKSIPEEKRFDLRDALNEIRPTPNHG